MPSSGYGSIEAQPLTGSAADRKNEEGTEKGAEPKKTIIAVVVASCLLVAGLILFSKKWDPPQHHSLHENEKKYFYEDQILDHFGNWTNDGSDRWSQKYYEDSSYFKGPGHPIFVVMGGEDAVDRILYPFISHHMAPRFGALTLCIEHRFYGESYPLVKPSNADLRRLLSPAQALADAVRLIQTKQAEIGCGPRGSPSYCPVMTVGGSYPGFLAVLMRLAHGDVVDIGYGSSAPLHLYSHDVDQYAYFDKISAVADQSSPGCAKAVRSALDSVQKDFLSRTDTITESAPLLGVCPDSIPPYIQNNEVLIQEVIMIVAAHFAENNMGYYPPGPDKELVAGCKIFLDSDLEADQKVAGFLKMREGFEECFDMYSELPPGKYGEISAADWSGVGDGKSGHMWDFQSCTLIPECGLSDNSAFPPRPWTIEWLTQHCERRFGYTPEPEALVNEFKFEVEDLKKDSRVLFVNGINDGWSVASITTNINDSVVAINLPNGAHHSDLSHKGPSEEDTADVKAAHIVIGNLLEDWINQIWLEYHA